MSSQDKTDEELVEMVRIQRDFFGILIGRYESRLAKYIRRLGVHDGEDVADILQEIFIKAYRNLNDFDTSLSFSSWIYRITHNETISWYRKHNVRPEGNLVSNSEDILLLLESDEWKEEDQFDAHVSAEELREVVKSLDRKYRDIIILRFFEQKEYEEISDILKIPIGTVGTLLHRAKKKLATMIDDKKIHV